MPVAQFKKMHLADGTVLDVAAIDAQVPTRSATSPLSPQVGDLWYDTSTGNLMEYQSATTGWTPPWNTAWGRVGSVTAGSEQGSITTIVDLTGMTITWTAVANRRYKISFKIYISNTTIGSYTLISITDSSNNLKDTGRINAPVVNSTVGDVATAFFEELGIAAGSTTRKLRATSQNTSTMRIAGVCSFLIEDIGPNGAPA